MEMNPRSDYNRPIIIARWPARSDSSRAAADKILATLSAVETAIGVSLAWSADSANEDHFNMTPFSTGAKPTAQLIDSFVKVDGAGRVWLEGGWTLLLYAHASASPDRGLVSVTGSVGATTKRGNTLQVEFSALDAVPSAERLAGVVEAVGEIWEAEWCTALSDEVIDKVNKPFGAPGVGFVTYWADTVQPTLPVTEHVKIRKTSKGTLAELTDWGPEGAIEYANLVHNLRAQ